MSAWKRVARRQDLKQGDEIKLTQSAVVLEKIISQFLYSKAQETPTTPKE